MSPDVTKCITSQIEYFFLWAMINILYDLKNNVNNKYKSRTEIYTRITLNSITLNHSDHGKG